MSIAQIREQIDELSSDERLELSEWLQEVMSEAPEQSEIEDHDDVALAEQRDAEIAAGTHRLLSEEEFWEKMHAFKSDLR